MAEDIENSIDNRDDVSGKKPEKPSAMQQLCEIVTEASFILL